MSAAKLEQDLQLLEEELEKIDITISDPIERNEYKKELQRKIKKLNRTKDSFKQLEKEQEELESLKYEVSTADEKEAATVSDRTNFTQDEDSLYDWVAVEKSDDNWNEESTTISKPSELAQDLEEAAQIHVNANSSQTSHDYLSRRKIWISTVFAIFGFIFPYIYTRRWKPFCKLVVVIVFSMFIFEEGEVLSIAPLISAIDNGIAISKSKGKLKQKLS